MANSKDTGARANNPPRNPDQPDAKDNVDKSLIQVAFPQQAGVVFFSAIALGVVLIFAPVIFRTALALDPMKANLILCIGAALILAAFGGQATVKVGSAIMAGVAAVAVGLFVYLQNTSQRHFLEGIVTSIDYQKYRDLRITNRNQILGSLTVNSANKKRSSYGFVIIKDQVSESTLVVSLLDENDVELDTLYVDIADIEWAFGSRERLEWDLRSQTIANEARMGLFDTRQNKFVTKTRAARIAPAVNVADSSFSFIGAAYAQAGGEAADLNSLLDQLKSDDPKTRLGARDALSRHPVSAIPSMMQAFRAQYGNYQVKLGICVALAQMLRADKSRGPAIAAKLTDEDFNRLLDAAGDPDRPVRVYATEFLFDLSEKRVAKLAIARAATTDNEDARYNWLFVSQGGWLLLSDSEKRALGDLLNQAKQKAGAKTLPLFDKLRV